MAWNLDEMLEGINEKERMSQIEHQRQMELAEAFLASVLGRHEEDLQKDMDMMPTTNPTYEPPVASPPADPF